MAASARAVSWLVVGAALVAFGGERADASGERGSGALGSEAAGLDDEASIQRDELGGPDDAEQDDESRHDGSDAAALAAANGGKRKKKRGGCPASMVRVRDYCVDRFEAPNQRGERPLVMRSASDAEAWCSTRRKRLCTEGEWVAACEGDERRTYPYAGPHVDGRCNDGRTPRPVDAAKLGKLTKWPSREAKAVVQELYQGTASGAKRRCVSEDGVYDLTGNVEEWVAREPGSARPYVLMGCGWTGCPGGAKPTCRSAGATHGPDFRDYETGFRCCRDVANAR